MPKTIQDICHDTVDTFIQMGILKPYERSGRFRAPRVRSPIIQPEQREILHYADCAGPLYSSDTDWEFCFRLVNSFTRSGQRGKGLSCTFKRVFGEIPGTGVMEVLDELPLAFAQIGFQTHQKSAVTRSGVFQSAGKVKMSKLPEPYGKYWQLKRSTPRWNEDLDLELQADVRLYETPAQAVVLDLTLSTVALPVVELLATALARQLRRPPLLPPPPPDLWRQAAGGNRPAKPAGAAKPQTSSRAVRRMRSF